MNILKRLNEIADHCDRKMKSEGKWGQPASWITRHKKTVKAAYSEIEKLRAERDEAAFALEAVLKGQSVRNADEIIARSVNRSPSDG